MATQARPIAPLNKTRLGEAVAIELGLSYADGIRAVETVLDIVTRAVTAGHPVNVTNFGTWVPVRRPARFARNPQTGERMLIPARQELTFRLSDRLRDLVAAADPATATIRKHPRATNTKENP